MNVALGYEKHSDPAIKARFGLEYLGTYTAHFEDGLRDS